MQKIRFFVAPDPESVDWDQRMSDSDTFERKEQVELMMQSSLRERNEKISHKIFLDRLCI
jgi:hypothetical protein